MYWSVCYKTQTSPYQFVHSISIFALKNKDEGEQL